jgi:hypothetical protein
LRTAVTLALDPGDLVSAFAKFDRDIKADVRKH